MKAVVSARFPRRRFLLSLLTVVFLLAVQSMPAWAQGGSSAGTVFGVVTDPQDAVIPSADVTLTNKDTGSTQKTTTQADGHYLFADVTPGTYTLSVAKKGFETTKITGQQVRVGLTTTSNVKLKVGAESITVEVRSTGNELQTLDASVGNAFDQQALEKLPSLNRDATSILLLQPLAQPGFNDGVTGHGEGNLTGGGIAGARADQSTFVVDGGDATSNTEGGGGYAQQANSGFAATPRAAIPTPVESLQEMRVVTNNSNTFARSTGGEVQMVTRSGTNAWHGAAYENNQNTDFNANSWQLNAIGHPRGIWQDNRFGGRLGGPIMKDKAFFFIMYEGRRHKIAQDFTRLVPSDLMRQGILQYKDPSGTVHQVNLATSTACGGPCDPRGIGISPVISKIWSTIPHGNNFNQGDGLNAVGFDSTVPVVVNENFAVAKFDYKLTQNWDLNSSYHYAVSDGVGNGQIDIGGVVSGDKAGVPTATRSLPTQPRFLTVGTTGHIGSNFTTEGHFNWLRHWWQWKPVSPFPQVSGTAEAVQIYAESATNGLVPMNIDTQNARSRTWNGKDFTYGDNNTWIKGKHILSFGGEIRHEHFTHTRDDKVVGALTSPVYFADKTSDIVTFGSPSNPFVPTGMDPAFLSNWQNAYVAMTGMISHASQLLTRGADFSPNPAGTPLHQDTIVDWYDLYFTDTWRMTSTLSVTLGLGWGAQTPPFENSGLQTIMIDTTTGKPIVYNDFLASLGATAAQGNVFAPQLGFAPIKSLGMKYPYNPEWNDFEPRISLAWNPSDFMKGFLGDRKTVVRAGYGRFHDRLNGVGLVMTPALGVGFGNTVTCRRVTTTDGCATLGKTTASDAFRIGVDGSTIPLPSLATVTPPLIPGMNSPFEALDFRIDPHRKVGVEDTWDLSIQRQLPSNTVLELGYVGRMAHHLYTAQDMNQVPYMITKGGQTFAAAYDAIASALRAGQTPAAQPFWETALGPGGTAKVVTAEGPNFINGLPTTIFDDQIGLPYLDNQIDNFQTTTSNGNSNYHAGYVSIRKQFNRGLLFQANYTWSHSLDTIGFTQENVFITPSDNFNIHRDYGPSQFDRRHTLNLFYVYDLPFGKNHFIGRGNNILDKIIGGWTFSGQFIAASGIPLDAINGVSGEEFGSGDQSGINSAMLPLAGAPSSSSAHYNSDGSVTAFGLAPATAAGNFSKLLFADQRTGHGFIRSFPRWNYDAAISKSLPITERYKLGFGMQAVNVFNHMDFNDPGLDISNPGKFGVVSTQYSTPRFLNLFVRVDF